MRSIHTEIGYIAEVLVRNAMLLVFRDLQKNTHALFVKPTGVLMKQKAANYADIK
jgi:hypothetical protein